jgi:hypothetical protein
LFASRCETFENKFHPMMRHFVFLAARSTRRKSDKDFTPAPDESKTKNRMSGGARFIAHKHRSFVALRRKIALDFQRKEGGQEAVV